MDGVRKQSVREWAGGTIYALTLWLVASFCMADVHSTTELYCEFRKLHPQKFNARALSTYQQQLHTFIRTTVPVEPIPRSYTVVDFERMQIVCVAVRREHDSASRHMMTHHECECFDSYILEIYP